jgi:hypothetical protein
MKRSIAICLAILASISTFNSQAALAVDSPPKLDYSSVITPTTAVPGDYLEISFRATDDVGISTIGPVVSIKSLDYPTLSLNFWNCYLTSGDRKDGNWKCRFPTDKTNPVGKYSLILVVTDTVGQKSVTEPASGYVTIGNFVMRELTAEEKAAAEKAVAEKAAAAKAVADKLAADKAAAAKAVADQAMKDLTDLMNLKSQVTLLQSQIKNLEGKLKKICSAKPRPKGC